MTERRIEYMPLSKVLPAKRNVKGHDIGLLSQSVTRFGYADAVVIDERTGRLVAGHGRVETLVALKARGGAPPDGVTVDAGEWLMPVQRGWASANDTEAEAFLVASNKTVEAGGWDEVALLEMMTSLAAQGADALVGTGFDGDDVDQMMKAMEPTPLKTQAAMNAELWQVLVETTGEAQQAELIAKLEKDGFKCRPLMF